MNNRRAVITSIFLLFTLSLWLTGTKSLSQEAETERAIIITFDDGPREWILPKILEFLRKEKILAAFFIMCWRADAFEPAEDLILKAVTEGHGIANHTFGHGNMVEFARKKGTRWVLSDVERCSKIIKNITGYSPQFFRPPFWAINNELQNLLENEGYIVQTLDRPSLPQKERKKRDVNTGDYAFYEEYKKDKKPAISKLVNNIRAKINERERAGVNIHILTFHELPVAIDALEILVPEWREKGYQFKTLPWLYGKSYGR